MLSVVALLLCVSPVFTDDIITAYHINPANYTGLANMNSGDAGGDAFFSIISVYLELFCTMYPHIAFGCDNLELRDDNITVTEVQVRVSKWGVYTPCNICANGTVPFTGGKDSCEIGQYVCSCDNSTCPPNATAVGRVAIASAMHFPSEDTPLGNLFSTLINRTAGEWYSTPASGECSQVEDSDCTWSVVETRKRIYKQCQDDYFDNVLRERNPDCFAECPQPRNTTSICFVNCFSQALVGIDLMGNTTGPGMNGSDIIATWLRPFGDDVCPPV